MNSKPCFTFRKVRTVVLWLVVLFLTTLFTLLFIMCFIHFLKNNQSPPIVPNDLQDYSTTKSIYFLLSFYFLLWTVVYGGCTVLTVVPRKSGHTSEKPGKALISVLLIILAIITFLLCTIDRLYSPWIMNFVNGIIFVYCVQVSGLISLSVGLTYLCAMCTMALCSKREKGVGSAANSSSSTTPSNLIIRILKEGGGAGEETLLKKNKGSFANPCYNIEFSISEADLILGRGEGDQGVTQV